MPRVEAAWRSTRAANVRLGSNGLVRTQVVGVQRARIVAAMLEVALESGAGSVSVADVVARSGVSRRTFYEIFSDREDCFLATFEDALERIAAVVVPAFGSGGCWRERVRAALGELLGLLDEDPSVGRFVIVESLAVGPRVLERREAVLARIIEAVEQGRQEASKGMEPPALTAEGVVGGVCSILYARLLGVSQYASGASRGADERRESFIQLTGPLTAMVVLPYLGRGAAMKELERAAPPPRVAVRNGEGHPFRDLGVRLTYRTLRVLECVAANPGTSNRQVADLAEISDPGQTSKLLSRLERLGLLANAGKLRPRGEANAWELTPAGLQLTRLINTHRGVLPSTGEELSP